MAAGVTALGAAIPAGGIVASAAAPDQAPQTVLVRTQPHAAASVADEVRAAGGTVTKELDALDTVVASISPGDESRLLRSAGVLSVSPDGRVRMLDHSGGTSDTTQSVGSMYSTTSMTGARGYWSSGYTGQGVDVALIDTGVAPVAGLSASNKVLQGPDLSFTSQTPQLTHLDEYGHGTAMAGIIAGRDDNLGGAGYTSPSNSSAFLGMAPDARLVNVKVGDENGVVDVSQVLAAIDWVVQHAHDPGVNIRVLNLSFGTDSDQSYLLDPLAFAAETAWRSGIVVAVAGGNLGAYAPHGLNDPANDPYVIAVGAADTMGTVSTSDDQVASFSSTGATGSRNPDLVAPGVHIETLRDPGSVIDQLYGSTATVGTRFFKGSGTSEATAVVSGAAALVISQHPDWTPDQVKGALTGGAQSLGASPALQGAGELNLAKTQTLGAGPAVQQTFAASTGTGKLETARGSLHVISNGVVLSGEEDIFGHRVNTSKLAAQEAALASWNGGMWNGSAWSGSGWSGSGWSGSAWSGSAWSGSGWSGSGWSGSGWSGSGWSGSGWSGSGWSGSGWSGSGWSGSGWSGSGWSGSGWSSASWT